MLAEVGGTTPLLLTMYVEAGPRVSRPRPRGVRWTGTHATPSGSSAWRAPSARRSTDDDSGGHDPALDHGVLAPDQCRRADSASARRRDLLLLCPGPFFSPGRGPGRPPRSSSTCCLLPGLQGCLRTRPAVTLPTSATRLPRPRGSPQRGPGVAADAGHRSRWRGDMTSSTTHAGAGYSLLSGDFVTAFYECVGSVCLVPLRRDACAGGSGPRPPQFERRKTLRLCDNSIRNQHQLLTDNSCGRSRARSRRDT
jgi:hypothetical protein